MNPADAMQAAQSAHDLSLWGFFWNAYIVVKLVIVGIMVASVWCWGHHRRQDLALRPHQEGDDRFEDIFVPGSRWRSVALAQRPPTVGLGAVFVAAMREWKRSFEGSGRSVASLAQRIDKVLDVTIQREVHRLTRASCFRRLDRLRRRPISAVGTVVGIMNSFTSIAASKNTSWRVGAGHRRSPLRDAIGCSQPSGGTGLQQASGRGDAAQSRLETFADEFSAILSRKIDERMALAA